MTPVIRNILYLSIETFVLVIILAIGIVVGMVVWESYRTNPLEIMTITECVEMCGQAKLETLDLQTNFLEDCCGRLCLDDSQCSYNCKSGFTQ